MPAPLEFPSQDIYASDNQAASSISTQDLSDEEKTELKYALDVVEQLQKDKEEHDNFDECDNFYKGKQWKDTRPKYRSSPVHNICRPTVETILPIMTDTSPSFSVVGKDPTDYDFAEILSSVCDSWWRKYTLDMEITGAIKDSLKYKAGVLKEFWDADINQGRGDMRVIGIDPRDIFVLKGTMDFGKNCPIVGHRFKKKVAELKRLFPAVADQIKADGSGSNQGSESKKSKAYSGDVIVINPVDQKGKVDVKASDLGYGSSKGKGQDVTVWELWLDDDELEDYNETNEDGIESTKQRLKYPSGKLITIIPSQKILCQSVANPRDDGEKPFIRFVDNQESREFWGCGEVETLIPTQKNINNVLASIFDNLKMTNNPVWIVDASSGVDPDMLTNQIGAVIVKTGQGDCKREQGVPLDGSVMNLYQLMTQSGDYESGVHDVTQGRKPAGITAAAAISTLQEAAQTRIRLKDRNLQQSLNRLARMVIGDLLQHYDSPRVIRITNNQKAAEYFEFYISKDESNSYKYNKLPYTFDETNKKYTKGTGWETSEPSKGMFDVEVVTGTSLPYMKDKRGQEAMKLYEAQVIDPQELLEALDWPRRESILQRMQAAAQPPAAGGATGAVPGAPPMPTAVPGQPGAQVGA